eukprot:gene8853-8944_t
MPFEAASYQAGQHLTVALRPEAAILATTGQGIEGTVKDVLFQGHRLIVLFEARNGASIQCFCPPTSHGWKPGDPAVLRWDAGHAVVMQKEAA